MKRDLQQLLLTRIANTAMGPSTARRMGPAGTIAAARLFLRQMDMPALSETSPGDFPQYLDAQTEDFLLALPRKAKYWGAARKFLNIFLRDVVYSRYLCEEWRLATFEDVLEVPLDSHVAVDLRAEPEGSDLPRWTTVIGLTPSVSAKYQDVASAVAHRCGFARVHLDLVYWRRRANQAPQRNAGAGLAISNEASAPHRASSFEKTACAQPPRG